jgi:glycogen synthase
MAGDTKALEGLFTPAEVDHLERARRAVGTEHRTVAYCVYENPFAKGGGIFAVADNLPSALRRNGDDVVVISPFHSNLKGADSALPTLRSIRQIDVAWDHGVVQVELLEHVRKGIRWVLLHAEGFFEAEGGGDGTNPYAYSKTSGLLTDSLFACAAIPSVLAALGKTRDVIVHLQDWEMASAALTVKLALLGGQLESAAVVLTSHNPYDHYLAEYALARITGRLDPAQCPSVSGGLGLAGNRTTVYDRMMPLTDAPVTTVSRGFAGELTTEPLQTAHFASHLQGAFESRGIVGISNGVFASAGAEPPFAGAAVKEAREGKSRRILRAKEKKRSKMIEVIRGYSDDPRVIGRLGTEEQPLPRKVPVFMMFGRMDPGQKGFDVLARAIEALPRGLAHFILTPSGALEEPVFLDDLAELAQSRPGEVVIYPFRMEAGYQELMAGASYVVMPSLYEPFGASTEPYLAGTPVVARATGGLTDQVRDIGADAELATGFLYREQAAASVDLAENWQRIEGLGEPHARMSVPLYGAMVSSLVAAIVQACGVYRYQPAQYARLLANGYDMAQSFSWEKAASEYKSWYELATE